MQTIERCVYIEAPLDDVFSYMGDPSHQLDCILNTEEFCIDNQSTYQQYDCSKETSDCVIEDYIRLIECAQNKRIVFNVLGNKPSTWTLTFMPVASGTRLNLLIKQFDRHSNKRSNERDAEFAVLSIKQGAESTFTVL